MERHSSNAPWPFYFFFLAAAVNTLSPCHIICPLLSAAPVGVDHTLFLQRKKVTGSDGVPTSCSVKGVELAATPETVCKLK